jgi:hypothetical protein
MRRTCPNALVLSSIAIATEPILGPLVRQRRKKLEDTSLSFVVTPRNLSGWKVVVTFPYFSPDDDYSPLHRAARG